MAEKSLREQLVAAIAANDASAIKELTAKVLKAEGGAPAKLPTVETAGVKSTMKAKVWASGTRGYIASFKGEINGERVQVNVNAFVVGSKGEGSDSKS